VTVTAGRSCDVSKGRRPAAARVNGRRLAGPTGARPRDGALELRPRHLRAALDLQALGLRVRPAGSSREDGLGLRFVKRAVQADLARFKAYVEPGQVEELEYHSKPAEREGEGEEKDDESPDESRERESAASQS
jgi:hypothetical protein